MAKTKIAKISGKYTINYNATVGTSDTLMIFNTLDNDQQGIYNSSTGVLTAPEAGTIDFKAALSTNYTAAAHDLTITVYKNGILVSDNLRTMQAGSGGRCQFVDSVQVAANDLITIRARCTAATTTNNSVNQNYFTFGFRR